MSDLTAISKACTSSNIVCHMEGVGRGAHIYIFFAEYQLYQKAALVSSGVKPSFLTCDL